MEVETEEGLKEVLLYLEKADLVNAQLRLSKLYEQELGCEEMSYTDRCRAFWSESVERLKLISNPYEKGQRLLAEWKSLTEFLSREKFVYEPARFCVQKGYFSFSKQTPFVINDTILPPKARKCYVTHNPLHYIIKT